MADHISTLVEVYNRWLENNDIKERGSADEILFGYEPLTDYQKAWLRRFIDVWEVAQDHEQTLPYVVEQIKEEKQRAKEDALYDIKRDYEK